MKTKVLLLLLLSVGCLTKVYSQGHSGFEGLKSLVGEWEATNNSGQFPEIEGFKWIYEPILDGKGISFKSIVKVKDQGWIPGVHVLMSGEENTNNIYFFGINNQGSSFSGNGTYIDNLFELKVYSNTAEKPLEGSMVYEITADTVIWNLIQYVDGQPMKFPEMTFTRIK